MARNNSKEQRGEGAQEKKTKLQDIDFLQSPKEQTIQGGRKTEKSKHEASKKELYAVGKKGLRNVHNQVAVPFRVGIRRTDKNVRRGWGKANKNTIRQFSLPN